MSTLPIARAADIEDIPAESWLIESLWSHRAVGVLGGAPKSGKSWMALDLAVSVASGTPALDRFRVGEPGPVLFFPAEDPLHAVRARIEGICRHRGLDFPRLDLWLIRAPAVRLDSPDDCEALEGTVSTLRPRLIVLDPFIRLHSGWIDENSATEIARMLSFLRQLERKYEVAVLVVHHARKGGMGDPGLDLRGSSEIRAWGDTNLYLRRRRGLELVVEHRCAVSPEPIHLALVSDDDKTHLAIEDAAPREPDLTERIIELLRERGPLTREAIRQQLEARNQTVGELLARLVHEGRIEKTRSGFQLRGASPHDDIQNAARPIPTLCWEATS